MTRERLIEIYEAELRRAFDDLGDDFDLAHGNIDFKAELLPSGTSALSTWTAKLLHGSAFTQEPGGKEDQRAQESENRIHGYANQSKRQHQQPYQWVQHEGQECYWPTKHKEDTPENEFGKNIHFPFLSTGLTAISVVTRSKD